MMIVTPEILRGFLKTNLPTTSQEVNNPLAVETPVLRRSGRTIRAPQRLIDEL